VNGTGLGTCSVSGLGISSGEHSGSNIVELAT